MDVDALVQQDHREVEGLFAQLDDPRADRGRAAHEIVRDLSAHSAAEEEVVYPPSARS
jgi:hemerythrin superfamily protein